MEGIQTNRPQLHMPNPGQEGNLEAARSLPITLPVPNNVVYSVHEYPPSTYDYVTTRKPVILVQQMHRRWGCL